MGTKLAVGGEELSGSSAGVGAGVASLFVGGLVVLVVLTGWACGAWSRFRP